MWKIEVITPPAELDRVISALKRVGVQGGILTDVRSLASQPKPAGIWYRMLDGLFGLSLGKLEIKIEVVVADGKRESCIEEINEVLFTDDCPVARLCVMKVNEAVRIRTGEKNENAV